MEFIRRLFGRDVTTDVIERLESQHAEVDALIAALEAGDGNRRVVFTELADKLAAHATVEEKLFYPAIMAKDTEKLLEESVEEHLSIRRILADLIMMKLDDDATFFAKLSVLKEQLDHHAHQEEEKELFPKVKELLSRDERAALGNEVLVMFEELMLTHPLRNVPSETAAAAQLPRLRGRHVAR